jgi:thioredoxin reductase (NADPH)
MECPTIRQVTEKLGWFRDPSRSDDAVVVMGVGPLDIYCVHLTHAGGCKKQALAGSGR